MFPSYNKLSCAVSRLSAEIPQISSKLRKLTRLCCISFGVLLLEPSNVRDTEAPRV